MTRFTVEDGDGLAFADRARVALEALAARPGCLGGRVGRAVDDPTAWLLVSEWDGVGAYRRALSAYDVRVQALPLLATGQDQPSAFEVLLTVGGAGADARASDRAPDAATVGPGGFPPPRDSQQETR